MSEQQAILWAERLVCLSSSAYKYFHIFILTRKINKIESKEKLFKGFILLKLPFFPENFTLSSWQFGEGKNILVADVQQLLLG